MIEASTIQMRKLLDRALADVEKLPVADQIDLHQAAAFALLHLDPVAANAAAYIAQLHREGERLQLKFRELLKS